MDMNSPQPATPFTRWLDAMVPAVVATDSELARLVGVGRSAINKWRHKGNLPQGAHLMALGRVTGTDPGTLLKLMNYQEGG
jgi:transcriptional regulator with XRE-family HTH domain